MIYIIGSLVLIVYIFAAVEFNNIAGMKGYSGNKYGWWCFLFPVAGYLMVIALPDREQPIAAVEKPVASDEELPEL